MVTLPRSKASTWTVPSWLGSKLNPDARFALAYDAVGDERRALLKSLIADHFLLTPPAPFLRSDCAQQLTSGLSRHSISTSRPFVLLLTDASMDAPALFLGALMPVLCSGAADVLVVRLGARSALSNVLLTACELAGQEHVAALGPALAVNLLSEYALSGLPGLVLYPDTPTLQRIVQRPALRSLLEASCLRLLPLSLPCALGLWRDTPDQFVPERLEFFYAGHSFEAGGAQPGRRTRKVLDPAQFAAFAAMRRDLLLVPDACLGAGQTAARLTVAESRVGLWTWPELSPDVLLDTRQIISSAPPPLS